MRLLSLSLCAVVASAEGDAKDDSLAQTFAQAAHPTAPESGTVFFQSFEDDKQLQFSSFEDYIGQDVNVRAIDEAAFEDDKALVLEGDAHRYGVTMNIPASASYDEEGDFVVQYEVRLSKGLECGGAYLKLLDGNNLPEGGNITPESPYIIMFGPDSCGDSNKVHFILRHQNPVSKEWEEKHFRSEAPLQAQKDKFSHLYTLVVRKDNTFTIKVDNKVAKSGNLLESMQPAINPPAEIDDPDDKKPSDWVDDAKIADPTAFKPEDWDEDQPKTIPDADASMPDGWLEDEIYLIPDPTAEKPEEWDDDDDGEWEAPVVQNPKCAAAPGCEKWQRPIIENPLYKGKWSAPLIDNPDYVGPWAPRKIPNPNFFVDNSPAEGLLQSVGAVGVEVWIHKFGGITFDNILLSSSEEAAEELAEKTFGVKADLERANQADLERKRRHEHNLKYLEDGGIIGTAQYYIYETVDLARDWPIAFAGGALAVIVALIYLCCITCCKEEEDDFDHVEETGAAAAAAAKKAAAEAARANAAKASNDGDDDEEDDDDAPQIARSAGDDEEDDDDAPDLKSPTDKKND